MSEPAPREDAYGPALDRAEHHTRAWLAGLPDRPVAPQVGPDHIQEQALARLERPPIPAADVVDELADLVGPGLMSINSGRFFGWVMGGVLPAALGADWLVSGWDQNSGMRAATPGVTGVEEAAGRFLLRLFGLPSDCAVGFATGATTANLSALAAGRHAVLARLGWDVEGEGLQGAPPIRVLVGDEVHVSVELALRYLGLGRPQRVAADDQGRMRLDALQAALETGDTQPSPVLVCLQAGNLHSGAFDPIAAATELAHRHGAWVHVDGAFGLWAATTPAGRELVSGLDRADSWATDAHKTLNVPYDCGVTIVRDPAALSAAMGVHASYLFTSDADPLDVTVEMSRRARGVPVWAALRSLGPAGVAELVAGLMTSARELARRLGELDGASVLNDVVYTQVCVHFGSDARTEAVTAAVIADGTTWMSGSRWQGRAVLRVSVSNWQTSPEDIDRSVDAVRRALAGVSAG